MLQGKYELDGSEENITCGVQRRQKKQFKRNKKEYERLSDHIGLLPLVLISPDDSTLVSGGSEERRKFVDGTISQYNNLYLNHLLQYNNALQQRNALLKNENLTDSSLFEIFEEQMCEHGNYIFKERQSFINKFVPIFQQLYIEISGGNEKVTLAYLSQLSDNDLKQRFLATRERDRILGYSTQGIHKDELEMLLDNLPLKRVGSQGQCKTFVISLKLAQFIFLKEIHNFTPILLLDDIFDKLDAQRVERIVQLVAGDTFGQIFITDTNREHLDEVLTKIKEECRIFTVENGNIVK
jgi:DNA replication and repair protein RecF